jgi:hypothetical protein
MSGNQMLPSAHIYSKTPVPALQDVKNNNGDSGVYIYGPLALVFSNDKTYYLADQKPDCIEFYFGDPNAYFVTRTDDIDVVFLTRTYEFISCGNVTDAPLPTVTP